MLETTEKLPQDPQEGVLVSVMQSSSKDIKKERANQALTNAHMAFKQKIDVVYNDINTLKIRQTDLIHNLVPKTTISTEFDVNTTDFVDKNIKILEDLTNKELWYEALKAEYLRLFGKVYVEPQAFL